MNRQIRFGLLLAPEEKQALRVVAEKEGGLTLAAALRRLIRQAAKTAKAWPVKGSEAKNDN